jgi:hypothetical protein
MGFLNPFLLFGVLSAAVPLLIHLWSRRQARTVEFSAFRFLLEAHRRTVRRFQLEHWLLLALRMLLLVCVAVALARPVVRAGGWFARARARTCAVVVLDNSASMGYRGVNGTAFEQGKARALDVLRSLQQGDEAGVVLMSDEPVSLFEPPSTQLGDVRQAIRSAPLTSRRTRVEGAVSRALGLLKRSSAPNRELYVISDFAQTAWNLSALDTGDARAFLVPVGDGESANASVQAVRSTNPIVAVNLPVAFAVTIRNWGETPMTQRTFEFLADDEVRASRVLTIPPQSEIQERVTHTFDTSGLHTIRVRLDNDRLTGDDVRALVVRVVGGVNATVVGSDTLYLTLGLNPNVPGEPNARAAIQPVAVPLAAFAGTSLDAADILFLQNPSLNDARMLARMENYLLNGGICVVCLGNASASFRGVEWLPVESDGVIRFAKPAKLRPMASEPATQRLFDVFVGEPWTKPSGPNFYQAHRLRVGGSARVLARFDDGTPALVDAAVKRGRLIVLNSPASRSEWSNLPLSPLFVPLIQQIALSAIAESVPMPASLEVGDGYERALSATDPVSIRVTTPDGQSRTVARSSDGTRVAFAETETTGVYRLSSAENGGVGDGFADAFAVNAPVEESDVTPASPEVIEAAFREKPVWLTDGVAPESDFGVALQERRLGRELSGYFLIAALLLALSESLLSNRLRLGDESSGSVVAGAIRVARSGQGGSA